MRSPPSLATFISHGQHTTGVCRGGGLNHYQRRGADRLQRPRRSRCRQRLMPSVAMTSNVKRWSQLFEVMMMLVSLVHRQRRSQSDPTVDPAAIRGLVTTVLAPSGACLPRGSSILYQPLHAAEGDTTPGRRLVRCTWGTFSGEGGIRSLW